LIIVVTIFIKQTFYMPVNSQVLSSARLGEIIDETEKSWEQEYEQYFDTDFINYSKTEHQIARQLAQLSQETGTKPAVMWAVPTEDKLYLLLITPNKKPILKTVNEANNQTLLKIIDLLYQTIYSSLEINSTAYLPPAKLLYKWLITPLEPDLKAANIDTLMLCSGPSLRSFPFAVLHDGKQFLIEKYSLVRLPAFNLTNISYEKIDSQNLRVLAMGVSQFPDRPPLPGVEAEVFIITPGTIPGKAILDQNSTVKNLKIQHQQGNFNLIHLATHSEFHPGSSSNSFIVFADSKLSLDKIKQLDLDNPSVDLLVLSSCETAVGNKEAEFGFAGLFLQVGVKSTLASLWKIDDIGTVVLMSEFYKNLKSNHIKIKALQAAQVEAIEGKIDFQEDQLKKFEEATSVLPTITKTKLQNLSHPFYWAGFTLIGNPW
jgi:CHAT domain-containing protein